MYLCLALLYLCVPNANYYLFGQSIYENTMRVIECTYVYGYVCKCWYVFMDVSVREMSVGAFLTAGFFKIS